MALRMSAALATDDVQGSDCALRLIDSAYFDRCATGVMRQRLCFRISDHFYDLAGSRSS